MSKLGNLQFVFVVIADTHMNQEEAKSSSPYECNKLANARTRFVIHQINRLSPEFVIHLGDMINPVPALPTYGQAAGHFKELARELDSPLYLVPGNHDIGDKPLDWMPAATVNQDFVTLYEEHFGKTYYSFDFNHCHFIVLNAQILNSGLECEQAQKSWFEADLEQHQDKRLFLSLHYPPYVALPDENSHYDNIDEPERSWLLALIKRYRLEALFAGHVHNFFYDRFAETDCYVLPSTTFVRHDYSELFKVEAINEGGRNDMAKLGYMIVKVYEQGHTTEIVRSYGETLAPGGALPPPDRRIAPIHTRNTELDTFGVDMRYPWAKVIEIPPSGAADEFERKKARNDYLLMALWEMGIRKMRIPIQDLLDSEARSRMRLLKKLGHAFTVYTFNIPQGTARQALIEHHELIESWEVVIPWHRLHQALSQIAAIKKAAPLKVFLSKIRSLDDAKYDGSHFNHFISHGFVFEEREVIDGFLTEAGIHSTIDGLVFRVTRDKSPWTLASEAKEFTEQWGLQVNLYVKMVSANPAENFTDDQANANRFAEAAVTAATSPMIDIFVDTLADTDRSYFLRTGLVDRRFNPRLSSHVIQHLNSTLSDGEWHPTHPELLPVAGGHVGILEKKDQRVLLVLPETGEVPLQSLLEEDHLPSTGKGEWIDLANGSIVSVTWEAGVIYPEDHSKGTAHSLETASAPAMLRIFNQ